MLPVPTIRGRFVLNSIVLSAGLIILACGFFQDLSSRKCPNGIIEAGFLAGILYAWLAGHFLASLITLILLNIMGLLFFKYRIMSAGDMKYLSLTVLFFNPFCFKELACFILFLFLFSLLYDMTARNKNVKQILTEIKQGITSLKLLIYRINPCKKLEMENMSKEEKIRETLPFTLPIYLALVLTLAVF